MRATVISDASYCPETKAGGWAVWATLDGKERARQSGAFKTRPPSVNYAELWAALNGLVIARNMGAVEVLLQTDSLSVVQWINGKGGDHMRKHVAALLRTHAPGLTVRAKHVKGHTTHAEPRFWCNRWCDAEAGKHMRRQRKELRQ